MHFLLQFLYFWHFFLDLINADDQNHTADKTCRYRNGDDSCIKDRADDLRNIRNCGLLIGRILEGQVYCLRTVTFAVGVGVVAIGSAEEVDGGIAGLACLGGDQVGRRSEAVACFVVLGVVQRDPLSAVVCVQVVLTGGQNALVVVIIGGYVLVVDETVAILVGNHIHHIVGDIGVGDFITGCKAWSAARC